MNTLTSQIAVPQITNFRAVRVAPDLDESAVYVTVQARSSGGLMYGMLLLCIARNGSSQGVRGNAAPTGFNDRVEVFQTATPTAFTDVLAADTGATLAARNRSVETALIAAGLLPAGVVS